MKNLQSIKITDISKVLEEAEKTERESAKSKGKILKNINPLEELAKYETKDNTYLIDGQKTDFGQIFVQGEDNQTYSNRVVDGVLEEVVHVKEANAIPFATIFAAYERYGELNTGKDVTNSRFVIELDGNVSDYTKQAYLYFLQYAKKNTQNDVSIEVRLLKTAELLKKYRLLLIMSLLFFIFMIKFK